MGLEGGGDSGEEMDGKRVVDGPPLVMVVVPGKCHTGQMGTTHMKHNIQIQIQTQITEIGRHQGALDNTGPVCSVGETHPST
jgi:hypothetical protein